MNTATISRKSVPRVLRRDEGRRECSSREHLHVWIEFTSREEPRDISYGRDVRQDQTFPYGRYVARFLTERTHFPCSKPQKFYHLAQWYRPLEPGVRSVDDSVTIAQTALSASSIAHVHDKTGEGQ